MANRLGLVRCVCRVGWFVCADVAHVVLALSFLFPSRHFIGSTTTWAIGLLCVPRMRRRSARACDACLRDASSFLLGGSQ